MKKFGIVLLFLGLASPALAQQVVPPADTINCAFNTVIPTVSTGQMVRVQCDSSGRFILAPTSIVNTISGGSNYETIAASQSAQAMGATGAIGDYLSHCVIYPTSTSPGVLTVFDNASAAGTNVIAFPGGATSLSNLAPIAIPVGAISVAGAWKVTTGANMVVTCYGKFT